jgi:hypothetical protein
MIVTMPTVVVAVTTSIVASPMTWEESTLIVCAILLAMVVDALRAYRRDFDDNVLPLLLASASRKRGLRE